MESPSVIYKFIKKESLRLSIQATSIDKLSLYDRGLLKFPYKNNQGY